MAGPGFQQIGLAAGGLAPLGTAPLGTSPLGGGNYPIYELPAQAPGSNPLARADRISMSRHTHERDNMIIGDRLIGERYRWLMRLLSIQREDMESVIFYARLRRFYMLPDAAITTQKIVVIWRSPDDLNFPQMPGRLHNIEAELEQLSGPMAVV